MIGYFVLAMIASVVMLFMAVFGLWAASSAVMTNPIALPTMLKSMMVYLPAVWMMIGVSVLLIGIFPGQSSISWGYLGFSIFVVYLGRLMQFPDWLQKTSPFAHIPQLPVDKINYPTLFIMTGIAIVLMVIGFIGYRKRDIRG